MNQIVQNPLLKKYINDYRTELIFSLLIVLLLSLLIAFTGFLSPPIQNINEDDVDTTEEHIIGFETNIRAEVGENTEAWGMNDLVENNGAYPINSSAHIEVNSLSNNVEPQNISISLIHQMESDGSVVWSDESILDEAQTDNGDITSRSDIEIREAALKNERLDQRFPEADSSALVKIEVEYEYTETTTQEEIEQTGVEEVVIPIEIGDSLFFMGHEGIENRFESGEFVHNQDPTPLSWVGGVVSIISLMILSSLKAIDVEISQKERDEIIEEENSKWIINVDQNPEDILKYKKVHVESLEKLVNQGIHEQKMLKKYNRSYFMENDGRLYVYKQGDEDE